MRILKSTTIAILYFSLLLAGCSRKPKIKFCPKWSDNLTEMWIKSTNVLNYDELDSKKYLIYGGMGKTSTGKVFVLLLRGKLPLGIISIKAVHIKNGNREPASILPNMIENNDPQANIRAIQIYNLGPMDLNQELRTYFRTYNVDTGRYYIFLEKDNVELAGANLLIR